MHQRKNIILKYNKGNKYNGNNPRSYHILYLFTTTKHTIDTEQYTLKQKLNKLPTSQPLERNKTKQNKHRGQQN